MLCAVAWLRAFAVSLCSLLAPLRVLCVHSASDWWQHPPPQQPQAAWDKPTEYRLRAKWEVVKVPRFPKGQYAKYGKISGEPEWTGREGQDVLVRHVLGRGGFFIDLAANHP